MLRLQLILSLFLLGGLACKGKTDPRCKEVAKASHLAGLAALEERYEGDELASLKAQLDTQLPKVERQCQTMLANDSSGIWSRWADCMVEASDADEVLACKSTE